MGKSILGLAAAVVLAIALTATPVEAKKGPKFCRDGRGHPVHGLEWCRDKGFDVGRYRHHRGSHLDRYRDRYRYGGSDRTWQIVRNDPCRWDEYRRFASEHENPVKRRRFAERLAREGCEGDRHGPYGYDDRYDPYHPAPYAGTGIPLLDQLFGR